MTVTLKKPSNMSNEDSSALAPDVPSIVRGVIHDIRQKGDKAVRSYSEKFDNWSPKSFKLSQHEIDQIISKVPKQVLDDIKTVQHNVRTFALEQRKSITDFEYEIRPGVHLGQKNIPINAVGAYVTILYIPEKSNLEAYTVFSLSYIPGGRYPLLASAHMTIVTAKAAGVKRVIACTPPIQGEIPLSTIAAMHMAGADDIYILGGVQAVTAMSIGTETIDKADFIAGPGNSFVAEAKRQLFGEIGIDLPAGPTEVLIIADQAADPALVATDLLSQAEHGPDTPAVAEKTLVEVQRQLKILPTAGIASVSWDCFGEVHVVENLDEAYRLADKYASEHVQILTTNPREALEKMSNYGALFLGDKTCVSYGDKCIGTNHVLPTKGAARFTGGLWVGKYLKTVTYQEVTSAKESGELGLLCGRAARVEKFEGHARSGDIRASNFLNKSFDWLEEDAKT
ncbi:histidinol dehydrogenase [Penicillium antarcticum]|uniref:histidinol dehydrogenase n=1 Tax=Penicillium antarcticum TaxID=416450 RepID=UPI00238D5503|nr:histidinol dehydrogenase [Penicillium antarcticum]KAJ5309164.1 histidinol dehydrogenase [Penicillium antarcticum]